MSLFKKKCEYCKKKIPKGDEVFRDVKVPEFIGTREKVFCSKNHASLYQKESENKKCGSGGGCCG